MIELTAPLPLTGKGRRKRRVLHAAVAPAGCRQVGLVVSLFFFCENGTDAMHPLLSIDIWSSFKNEKQQLPTVQHQPLSTRGGKLVRRVTGPLFGRRRVLVPSPSLTNDGASRLFCVGKCSRGFKWEEGWVKTAHGLAPHHRTRYGVVARRTGQVIRHAHTPCSHAPFRPIILSPVKSAWNNAAPQQPRGIHACLVALPASSARRARRPTDLLLRRGIVFGSQVALAR